MTDMDLPALCEADALRDRALKRSGLTRKELRCPHAKSDMTPCVARDGRLAVYFTQERGVPCCVGCERSLDLLTSELEAKP